jgi:AcrR family transcriptional regulator
MSKARQTKDHIIRQAAELFNRQGYTGASIADLMVATGLKKGGIYNHFLSKEELALAAFDYAHQLITRRIWQAIKTRSNAVERLQAFVASYLDYIDNPPIEGGCPILNTAIATYNSNSQLKERVRQAMKDWHHLIVRIIYIGIKKGEITSPVEPEIVATILISTIEGAIMMSKLDGDPIHLQRVVSYLQQYLQDTLGKAA